MSNSNEPKRVIAWGRIFFVAIIVVILANFGKISSFFGSVFAPVIYDEIDPFSDMLVEVSGTEPFITLEYTDISGDPFLMENVKYEADKTSGLSNGDVVTITATASKRALKAAKKQFTRTTMQYTVEGQPFYITPDTELTDEQLQYLNTSLYDLVQSKFTDDMDHLQSNVQEYLFDDSQRYKPWLVTPVVYLDSLENTELVVMPASDQPGNVYLLSTVTATFRPDKDQGEPQQFTACMRMCFTSLEMDGNEVTSWYGQYIKFYDDVSSAVISIKKENAACREFLFSAT